MVDDTGLTGIPEIDTVAGVERLTDEQMRALGNLINANSSGQSHAIPDEHLDVLLNAGYIADVDGEYRATDSGRQYFESNTR